MSEKTNRSGPVSPIPVDVRTTLEIDLARVRRNWRKLDNTAAAATCAAVVKANGYGLGLEEIITAVAAEGCRIFFVATLEEGRRARIAANKAEIYIMDGLLADAEAYYSNFDLRPVLSSAEEIADWTCFCTSQGRRLPAALHVDTGMRRLGVPLDEFMQMAGPQDLLSTFELTLLMSHLTSANQPEDPQNQLQLQRFEQARSVVPGVRCSLANSAGIFLGPEFHFDVVRPGIAIYGGRAFNGKNPMANVVKLNARILEVQCAEAGDTVGYGAVHRLTRPSRIATVAVGYADGLLRVLGGDETAHGALAFIGDHQVPVIGRISMDLTTLNVTDVPEHLARRGGWIEMIGDHVTVDDLADRAGTIGYEILTRLGPRMHRIYHEA